MDSVNLASQEAMVFLSQLHSSKNWELRQEGGQKFISTQFSKYILKTYCGSKTTDTKVNRMRSVSKKLTLQCIR